MNAEPTSRRKKIAVIGTGGTFAMHGRHRFDWTEYSESGVVHPINLMIEHMGELAPDIDLLPLSFRMLGSTAIEPRDWLELSRFIKQAIAREPDIDGFVITHGTATLEETVWFLDLAVKGNVSIVVTGAQRPANTAGSDVAGNLRAALAVAVSEPARTCGALVVMNNQVFSARDVTKVSSFELAAFECPVFGPLADVDADAYVNWRRYPARKGSPYALDLSDVQKLPRVDMAIAYAGADGTAIKAMVDAGAQGLIHVGLAPGRPAQGEVAALEYAVQQGVVVVQSSRALRGAVPPQSFLQRAGVLAGGDLSPHKLRILLMLALTQTTDPTVLQEWMMRA
jgi:L-asparaginase